MYYYDRFDERGFAVLRKKKHEQELKHVIIYIVYLDNYVYACRYVTAQQYTHIL